jgi:hypothetical protein
MGFTADLNFGKKYEEIAKKYVTEGEEVIESPEGKFKAYDYKTNLAKYEVKADRLAHKYGCRTMFIEYECNGNRSGIETTEADFWFYFMVMPDGSFIIYEIPIQVLKDACKSSIRMVSGGDGGRVRGHIVSVEKLQEYKLEVLPVVPAEEQSCLVV